MIAHLTSFFDFVKGLKCVDAITLLIANVRLCNIKEVGKYTLIHTTPLCTRNQCFTMTCFMNSEKWASTLAE